MNALSRLRWLVAYSAAAAFIVTIAILPPFNWLNIVCLVACSWNVSCAHSDYRKIKSCLTSN